MRDSVASNNNEQLKDVILVMKECGNYTFKGKIVLTVHCTILFKYLED